MISPLAMPGRKASFWASLPNFRSDPPHRELATEITEATTFATDLEFDSLTVMDFVAAIEDEFDIIISMNQQAEIETYGQLVDTVTRLQAD